MSEEDAKLQFAALLVERPKDALLIAKSIVGSECAAARPMFVIEIAESWAIDPLVLGEMERLRLIPVAKEIIEKELLYLARNEYVGHGDRIKAYELVAKIGGHIVNKTQNKDEGKSDDRLKELAAMVMGGESYESA